MVRQLLPGRLAGRLAGLGLRDQVATWLGRLRRGLAAWLGGLLPRSLSAWLGGLLCRHLPTWLSLLRRLLAACLARLRWRPAGSTPLAARPPTRWAQALGEARLRAEVALRILRLALRPADPNNLFLAPGAWGTGAHAMAEAGRNPALDLPLGEGRRPTLLLVGEGIRRPPDALARRVAAGIAAVNRHAGREALLATELKRLQVPQIRELDRLIGELARRWLGPGPALRPVERRNRLDLRRTLRANLQRHGGYVLTFRWAVRQRPRPRLQRPARLLVIGDVSHSMCHYVTVVLYFFHMLNFRFEVESYVFSEHATRASPYLSGPGGFSEKVQALAQHARSWNAGTRFGTSLEEILAEAAVDPHTYVVIATDGKVSLSHGEPAKIRRQMERLRRESRMVILLTPEADLARAGRNRAAPVGSGDGRPDGVVGIFKAGLVEIPIFDLPSVWYEVLGQHADRVYHVRTVQDLVDMVEDLNRMAPPVSPEPASPGGYELGR